MDRIGGNQAGGWQAGQGGPRSPTENQELIVNMIRASFLQDLVTGCGERAAGVRPRGRTLSLTVSPFPASLGEAELGSCFLESLENPPWTGLDAGRESHSIMYV